MLFNMLTYNYMRGELYMENKRNNIYIVIFFITTIIASCLAVYFAIAGSSETEKLRAEVKELNSQNDKPSENSQVIEDNTQKQEQELVSQKIDASNCLNNEKSSDYNEFIGINKNVYGLSCFLGNSNEVILMLDMNYFNDYFPGVSSETEMKNWNLNFDKNVVNFAIGSFGRTNESDMLFFIMEDGTVEYMPIITAIKNNSIKSYGKLEGVSDIVDIKCITESVPNGEGWTTTAAFNKSGKFYDLDNILSKMNVLQ